MMKMMTFFLRGRLILLVGSQGALADERSPWSLGPGSPGPLAPGPSETNGKSKQLAAHTPYIKNQYTYIHTYIHTPAFALSCLGGPPVLMMMMMMMIFFCGCRQSVRHNWSTGVVNPSLLRRIVDSHAL